MYGGKIDSTGNVTSELWVFHTRNQSWVLLNPNAKEQYAVVGHSAHTVQLSLDGSEPVILVVFGHCPLYGYISRVQQYDIGQQHAVLMLKYKTGRDIEYLHYYCDHFAVGKKIGYIVNIAMKLPTFFRNIALFVSFSSYFYVGMFFCVHLIKSSKWSLLKFSFIYNLQ